MNLSLCRAVSCHPFWRVCTKSGCYSYHDVVIAAEQCLHPAQWQDTLLTPFIALQRPFLLFGLGIAWVCPTMNNKKVHGVGGGEE